MLISDKKINVTGEIGTYIRNNTTRDMFKEVSTEYNLRTSNLETYLANKIKQAKDITRVFKNLEKQGYTVTTVQTVFNINTPCFNTEIGGIFNGNIRTINVLWVTSDREDYKQSILGIIK